MKKKTMERVFTLLIALAMFAAIIIPTLPQASAWGETLKVGTYYDIPIAILEPGWKLKTMPAANTVVPGMMVTNGYSGDGNVYLEGIPTSSGTYNGSILTEIVRTDDPTQTRVLNLSWNITVVNDYSPVPTPTPTPAVPVVTKHPTSETVAEGGRAVFVAYANGYSYMTWNLITPNGEWISINNINNYFPYLGVDGRNSAKLILTNVPKAMNNYRIVATFVNSAGNEVSTNGSCYLTVNNGTVTVTKNPTSETVSAGGSCTFVTYGANCIRMDWYLVSPTGEYINADTAATRFAGLKVSYNTLRTYLYLSNVPAALNGYRIVTVLQGSGGTEARTNGNCTLTVRT